MAFFTGGANGKRGQVVEKVISKPIAKSVPDDLAAVASIAPPENSIVSI
jgi:hypothetical protein